MTPVCCPAAQPAKAQKITDTLENRIWSVRVACRGGGGVGACGAPHSKGSWGRATTHSTIIPLVGQPGLRQPAHL